MTRSAPKPEFTPVTVSPRADGWTPDRQLSFISALCETASVATAARQVGMSRESVYRLRARPDAAEFRLAWEAAMTYAFHRLGDAALDRALNGVPVPIFYKGEQVGERRHFDERLTQFLLRTRDERRYTTAATRVRICWDWSAERVAEAMHRALGALADRRSRDDSAGSPAGDGV